MRVSYTFHIVLSAVFILFSPVCIHSQKCLIHIGKFSKLEDAKAFRDEIANMIAESVRVVGTPPCYEVGIGPFSSIEKAKSVAIKLIKQSYTISIISSTPLPPILPQFGVQIGAFIKREEADSALREYKCKRSESLYIHSVPPYYKLIAGNFQKMEEAEKLKDALKDAGYSDAFIVSPKERLFRKETKRAAERLKDIERKVIVPLKAAPVYGELRKKWKAFCVEVDVFRSKVHAERLKRELMERFVYKGPVIIYSPPYYKVVFTDFRNVDEAIELVNMLQKFGYKKALVIFE